MLQKYNGKPHVDNRSLTKKFGFCDGRKEKDRHRCRSCSGLQDVHENLRVPTGLLSARFDAALGFIGADEIKGETAHDGHVFGTVAGSVSRQIVPYHPDRWPVQAAADQIT
jgi:hypothetical protein